MVHHSQERKRLKLARLVRTKDQRIRERKSLKLANLVCTKAHLTQERRNWKPAPSEMS